MAGAEFRSVADVKNHRTVRREFGKLRGRQGRDLLESVQGFSAGTIDLGIFGKVSGRFGQVSRHQPDEIVFGHWLQRVVELALLAYGRRSFRGKISSAHRAGAVRGINLHCVIQLEKFFVQAVIHHRCHRLFRETFRAGEIGPADVADEKRVAGEYFLWLIRDFAVSDQNANSFRRMARSFHEAQLYFADCQFVAVFDCAVKDRGSGFLAENDFRAGARRKFAMPADKVRMQVSFDYVLDLEIVRGCFVDVLIDIALWIYDYTFAIRADQIRSMSETIEIELLEVHGPSAEGIRSGEFSRKTRQAARLSNGRLVRRFDVSLVRFDVYVQRPL